MTATPADNNRSARWMRLSWSIIFVMLVTASFAFATSRIQAQYSRFLEPRWHPSQNIIALTDAARIRFYTSDFTQLLEEYALIGNPEASPRIGHLEWSPNGNMIAVSLEGDNVRPALQIWDFQTDQLVLEIVDISADSLFAWGQQSNQIALVHIRGLGDHTIRIYEIPSGSLLQEFEPSSRGSISKVAWSPDGNQIALNLAGENSGLYLLDVQTGIFAKSPTTLLSDPTTPQMVFSPDSTRLIGIQEWEDTSVTILDTSTYGIIETLNGHTNWISSVHWTEQHLATVSYDGTTRFWNPDTGEQLAVFETGITSELSFSPDGSLFAADAFEIDTIVVRTSTTGEIVASLDDVALLTPAPNTSTP